MRLFIAISFSKEVRQAIYDQELMLRKYMYNGHITSLNNIHLTLVFIGETMRPKDISDCIDKIDMKSFNVFIKGVRYFIRAGKRLYYLDINDNPNIYDLYDFLYCELISKGFDIEERDYKPHITLAREVLVDSEVELDDLNMSAKIEKISLMESKRIDGKLEYVELYSKKLED